MNSIDESNYKLWFSPRRSRSIWSPSNRKRAENLIATGDMAAPGLAAIEEAKKNGRWDEARPARRTHDLPKDLAAALKRNPAAWKNFTRFANGYRNTYIAWVNDAKRSETRSRRIARVVERSAENKKPGIDL
jgi:uncharacterized protein YdeI (YjbR/CyaY-like superfamily)